MLRSPKPTAQNPCRGSTIKRAWRATTKEAEKKRARLKGTATAKKTPINCTVASWTADWCFAVCSARISGCAGAD